MPGEREREGAIILSSDSRKWDKKNQDAIQAIDRVGIYNNLPDVLKSRVLREAVIAVGRGDEGAVTSENFLSLWKETDRESGLGELSKSGGQKEVARLWLMQQAGVELDSEYKVKNSGDIEDWQQGYPVLDKSKEELSGIYNKWEKKGYDGNPGQLAIDLLKFQYTPAVIDRLPDKLKKFADHDTRVYKRGINQFIEAIVEDLIDNSDRHHLSEITDIALFLAKIMNRWEMYESAMRDILIRQENKVEGKEENVVPKETIEEVGALQAIEPVLDYFRGMKGFDFDIDKSVKKSDKVKINPYVLRNILQNIMINARSFSPEEIKVTLNKVQGWEKEKYYILGIYNNGRQLTEQEMQHLFSEGYTSRDGGSGLGLAGADERLRSMGCDIKVKNDCEVGDNGSARKYNVGFEIKFA